MVMITLKLEQSFLNNVDEVVKDYGYQNRTEFIRNALREKINDEKMKEAMISIARLKGASKKKTTEKEYRANREQAFEELDKKRRMEGFSKLRGYLKGKIKHLSHEERELVAYEMFEDIKKGKNIFKELGLK